ncbi:hypothetical protein [Clostridium saccharoperbutylacetonicum]|uniref:Uncharacterized protein n=1 Tax=Clostridium saccharoperbutylacetonicum N1-4(HMT) TaxID=931276 RepID=M1LTZ0_9CLOT|nr:hypothetical protein [Clostridium saccharoperbutylacetonicum]AGF56520.1 hypothetical protein Cspa_c27570 [Clostridium saccharoperbutylacetonicum N1-4(HMT)]AQR95189.1 hypothetical protein CLSAP_25050 [Clostridium saccharoperbutylacetonicum]NRT62731.1 hypothetical protein [Clostridium saccharoperbutylacetonicum]NSB26082.1 hypothetical protein [Clostridium saccharoperbutylacetonicum]NSB31038.1 hypothetical protein [Clostridium saccharoperbutylacetonicum]
MSNMMMVKKMVRGGFTLNEADELMDKLSECSERQVIDDLKQIEFESSLKTEQVLEDCLDTISGLEANEENILTINQCKRSLEFIEIATSES